MNGNGTMEQVSDQSGAMGYAYCTSDNSPEMIKKYENQLSERTLDNAHISLYNAFGNKRNFEEVSIIKKALGVQLRR
jgi:hypothetical protein